MSTVHYRGYTLALGVCAICITHGDALIGYRNTLREAFRLVDSLTATPVLTQG